MKRFFTQIAIYASILLVLAIAFDWMISSGLKKTERGHFHTMNALMNDTINADAIILGGSRASFMYNPHVIDTVLGCYSFNLGVSGQPFGVSCLRWQLYNRKNNPPRLIIINSDFMELSKMVENGYEREQYYPYMYDPLVQTYLNDYGFTWTDKFLPAYRYHGDYKIMGIGLAEFFHVRHDHKGNPYKGYTPSYNEWNGSSLDMMVAAGELRGKVDEQVVRLLDSLVRTAILEGSKVVFVHAPYHSRLRDNLDETVPQAVYDSLANVYAIPYLDYTHLEICNDSTYFQDGSHLNFRGSIIFSLKLARDLDSLNIIER